MNDEQQQQQGQCRWPVDENNGISPSQRLTASDNNTVSIKYVMVNAG